MSMGVLHESDCLQELLRRGESRGSLRVSCRLGRPQGEVVSAGCIFALEAPGCGLGSLPEDLWGSAPDSDPAPGGGPFFLSPLLLLFHLLLFCSREDEEERR